MHAQTPLPDSLFEYVYLEPEKLVEAFSFAGESWFFPEELWGFFHLLDEFGDLICDGPRSLMGCAFACAAADLFLWRNKKISVGALGAATAIWVLFELLQYHLLALVCHGLILSLTLLFIWSYASSFINK